MKNKIKKGFTLVELLVVIAILAILSTVAVVGYSAFTEKANISVDQQAVVQMNKVLQANEVNDGKAKSPMDAAKILEANGYNGSFETYHSNYELVWIKDANRMALMENDVIVFPEEFVGLPYSEINTYSVLSDLPQADTEIWEKDMLNVNVDYSYNGDAPDTLLLDAAMNFSTSDTVETINGKFYDEYYVDFVIRANQDVNFNGYLWGSYGSYLNIAIPLMDDPISIKENATNNVMLFAGMFLTYEDIVRDVISFDCGILVSEETKNAYSDLVMTLELWIYEDVDSETGTYIGDSYMIGNPYSFKIN